MPAIQLRLGVFSVVLALLIVSGSAALAQKKYDVGATDIEIKIGNIVPYSGPVSAFGVVGKTAEAYFRKVNAEGGINGRKIKFISYDDAYSPPKTVEQARKLVESDEVLFLFQTMGTNANSAIQKYLNTKNVPQLFVVSGATKWNDPKGFPWTMGWRPSYQSEINVYVKYILKNKPDAKIAVLYQNDDYGKDYLKGLKDGLGAKAASMIVIEEAYDVSQPTIDSHIVKMKSMGADVFINIAAPKYAAQAIRKTAEIGWKPLHFLNSVSSSIGSVIVPAGKENAQGVISSAYLKDATDLQWKTDAGMVAFNEFLDKYYPEADRTDAIVMDSYTTTLGLVHVLKACGDNLTRENVMKQAASIKDLEIGGLLPGIKVNTSSTDFAPISQMQLIKFKGDTWERFGEILSGDVGD